MKYRLDVKSLKFKLWAYFLCFAALLMIIVWVAHIYMLNYSYEEMKANQVTKFAQSISAQYRTSGFTKNFIKNVKTLSATNDIDIVFEDSSGFTYYISRNMDEQYQSIFQQPEYSYVKERAQVKKYLENDGKFTGYTARSHASSGNYKTLIYGSYLDISSGDEIILYLFAPLYPVSSTVSILRSQLVYVTFIALFMAFFASIWLARRITRPLKNISDSAVRLSQGEYGVDFAGEHYTEIINLGETLNFTSHELAKSDQLKKDLIANVSHDLKTPLTMVKSYAEMIRDISGYNEAKRNEHLQVIIEETDRLNLLVDDMFTLSKMQAGVVPVEMKNFDLIAAACDILNSYELMCEQEGYRIVFSGPESCSVTGDPSKIRQVISNLINNAIKYCGDDKYIEVNVEKKNGRVKFSVTDHGLGIAEEDLAHVWERYYRVSSNYHRSSSGTGLGLSIVSEILKRHNADYGASSTLGEGSTFWFELSLN